MGFKSYRVHSLLIGLLAPSLISSRGCEQALLLGTTEEDPIVEWARSQCTNVTSLAIPDTSSPTLTQSSHLVVLSNIADSIIAMVALDILSKTGNEGWLVFPNKDTILFRGLGLRVCNQDIENSLQSQTSLFGCLHRSPSYRPPALITIENPQAGAVVARSSETDVEISLAFSLEVLPLRVITLFPHLVIGITVDGSERHSIVVPANVLSDAGDTSDTPRVHITLRGVEVGTHSVEVKLFAGLDQSPLGSPAPSLVFDVASDDKEREYGEVSTSTHFWGLHSVNRPCHWSAVLPQNTSLNDMIVRPVSTSGLPANRALSVVLIDLCSQESGAPSSAVDRAHWISAASLLPTETFMFQYLGVGCSEATSEEDSFSRALSSVGVQTRHQPPPPARRLSEQTSSLAFLSAQEVDVVVVLLPASSVQLRGSLTPHQLTVERVCEFVAENTSALVCVAEPSLEASPEDGNALSSISSSWSQEKAASVDALFTTSPSMAASLRSTATAVIEVPPGISPSLPFRQESMVKSHRRDLGAGRVVVAWVGRLEPRYSPGLVLKACASLLNSTAKESGKSPGVRCVLVGTGFLLEPLRDLARNLGVADDVQFDDGKRSYKSLLSLLSDAHVLVSTSPRVFAPSHTPLWLDAAAMGLALVAAPPEQSTCGGDECASEIICHGWNGMVATRRTWRALQHAIEVSLGGVQPGPRDANLESPVRLQDEKTLPLKLTRSRNASSADSTSSTDDFASGRAEFGDRGRRLAWHRFSPHMCVTSLAEAVVGTYRAAKALRGWAKYPRETVRASEDVSPGGADNNDNDREEHGLVPGTPRFTGGVRVLRDRDHRRHANLQVGEADESAMAFVNKKTTSGAPWLTECEDAVCARLPAAPPPKHLRPPLPRNVAVLHYRPPEQAVSTFEVGFREALSLLRRIGHVNATMVNLHDLEAADSGEVLAGVCNYMERFDAVWVKANWKFVVDAFAREFLGSCAVPRVLLVSGSYVPPSVEALFSYDALAFEVFQYETTHLWAHPVAAHAFGIDTRVMAKSSPPPPMRTGSLDPQQCGGNHSSLASIAQSESEESYAWDVLFIGAFADHVGHKRPTLIGTNERFKGLRRAAIGKHNGPKAAAVVEDLRAHGVVVLDPLPYDALATLIQKSRIVYVPDDIFGGGERAVLEARSLGVQVAIEDDNPKLRELLTSPIYDHMYYAQQLSRIQDMVEFSVRLSLLER